jgi:protein KRI1
MSQSRPITMRQVALKSALNATSRSPSPQPLPHVEEQHALRSETIAVFHNAVMDDDDDDDDLLIPREKTTDEMGKEEEEYREFLAREVGEDLEGLITIEEDVIGSTEGKTNEVKQRKSKKSKDKGQGHATQETDQEFLMKYEVLTIHVILQLSSLPLSAIFSIVVGSTALQTISRLIRRSRVLQSPKAN